MSESVAVATPPGLTSARAQELLDEVGPNRLPDPPRVSVVRRAGVQLRDPMILLLLAAAVLTSFLRDWSNTVIISAVVVFNTVAGVVQELRAERAMASLRRLVSPVAQVWRDQALVTLPSELVVPGDVVVLTAGDVVAADGDIVEARELQLNEASMTGESLPVEREAGEEVTGGTLVTKGRAAMLVTRTGARSGLGRIASGLAAAEVRRTPLQRRLARLSRTLVWVVVALTLVVVAIGLVQGRPLAEMAVVGLSLAVAAVPESLPAVVTVALAMGAHRMARRNAVVRSLPAVETLGSVTVVATDKTGTITEGTMLAETVWTPHGRHAVTGSGYAPDGSVSVAGGEASDAALERLVRDIALCNDARLVEEESGWSVMGDPLEGALLALVAKTGGSEAELRRAWPRVSEEPFDHRTRRMLTRHRSGERQLTVCKGAPEAVLGMVVDDEETVRATAAAATELADDGYRVIAVADDAAGGGLTVSGLVAIGDPPRRSAGGVVSALKRAGVRLVLVTGDHPGTAEAISRRVGIAGPADRAVLGSSLRDADASVGAEMTVVARVQPEQKVDVVTSLQSAGDVVAMLGDGVNDAPALRRADIGVAAGLGGTEVAKEAADLVLMDDDLGTVVAAVEEGRRIFANIGAFLAYALSGGLSEVGVMVLGPAIGLGLPLLPGQILWINLVTHGLTGVAFGGEPADPRDMSRPPRPATESIFSRSTRTALIVAAVTLTAAALVASLSANGTAERRTAVFLALGLGQLGVALALRVRAVTRSWRDRGLELALVAAAGMMAAATTLPVLRKLLETTTLSGSTVLVVAGCAVVPGILVRLAGRRTGV